MPVHKYDIKSRHDRDDLVMELANELRRSMSPDSPSVQSTDAPDIYVKEGAEPDRAIRIYVVWGRWINVPEVQRSGIILDSLVAAQLHDWHARVAIAMGLTPVEADALGLERQ